MYRSLLVTIMFIVANFVVHPTWSDEPPQSDQASAVQWAIAIHGGASDPAEWNADQQAARRQGLTRALDVGRQMLSDNGAALDVVEAVIRTLEDDPLFNAGRGAVRTQAGRCELDSSIMDGHTRACGAIAGVTTVKNPISLARRVMSNTKHVLLAGKGAEQFAAQQQLELVDPDYFLSAIPAHAAGRGEGYLGTVGCVVRDTHGNLAAGTSTGGTDKKLPGRIGDSPIIGAGTYAANDTCAVSGTGVGEEYIRNSIAYDVAAQIRYAGKTLAQAVNQSMRETLKPNVGGLITVSAGGEIVLQHNTRGMSCGAADSSGRFDIYLQLPDGVMATQTVESAEVVVRRLLEEQLQAWNEGNIERFMHAYWQSPELTFSSGGEVTRGYDATLARYKQRYPDRQTMGKVNFEELEFLPLGVAAMQVQGVWQLQRAEPIGGRFTLVLRKFADGWKIVHDHTSVRNES
ncbi:MAG: isoaspartyl peptidase/L-asparaginase [Planctomycetales bacterium]|nr:isoaspartyl peptidase/L-asparaginase [Planctomycetales bacterium]